MAPVGPTGDMVPAWWIPAAASLALLVVPVAAGSSVQTSVTVLNVPPLVVGGNAEPLPLGSWRLWIDAKDPNGSDDIVWASARFEGPGGARVVPMMRIWTEGEHARFEAEMAGEPGLRWVAVGVGDGSDGVTWSDIPREPLLEAGSRAYSHTSDWKTLAPLAAAGVLAAFPGFAIVVRARRLG